MSVRDGRGKAVYEIGPMLRAIGSSASLNASMSTLQEIKTAIGRLDPSKQAILTAELLAMAPDPEEKELEAALERGLRDAEAGRARPIEEVRDMVPRWISKS